MGAFAINAASRPPEVSCGASDDHGAWLEVHFPYGATLWGEPQQVVEYFEALLPRLRDEAKQAALL